MADATATGAPDRRRVLVLAGVAAAVVLAILVLPGLLFGGGGGDTDAAFLPPPSPTPTTVTDGRDVPETGALFSDKNPFAPLVADIPAGDPNADGATTDTTLPPGDVNAQPVEPFPTVEPLPPDGEQPPPDGGGSEGEAETPTTTAPPRQPDRVALIEVFSDASGNPVATLRVNDVVHQVGEGADFAGSYRVLSLDLRTRCASLLFGDDRFGLCEGEETLK